VLQHEGGRSSIAMMRGNGTDLREVTQGDTLDDAPRWSPASK
jgi:Tol biopolymer transport system component